MGFSETPSLSQTIAVVDDCPCIRNAVEMLLTSLDYQVLTFASADAFLEAWLGTDIGCLILDIRMPGRSGLDLQDHLNGAGARLPIIFITGFADVPITVRAMKAGAIDVLAKPFREQELLDAVQRAVLQGEAWRREAEAASDLRRRYETLTPRERDILGGVTAGRLNKQIACDLGVTEITVKIHRGHVMRKMQARSLAELVRLVDRIAPQPDCSWAA